VRRHELRTAFGHNGCASDSQAAAWGWILLSLLVTQSSQAWAHYSWMHGCQQACARAPRACVLKSCMARAVPARLCRHCTAHARRACSRCVQTATRLCKRRLCRLCTRRLCRLCTYRPSVLTVCAPAAASSGAAAPPAPAHLQMMCAQSRPSRQPPEARCWLPQTILAGCCCWTLQCR